MTEREEFKGKYVETGVGRCLVERFETEIPVDRYIRDFRDGERFIGLCRQCPNYAATWACPPFDFDAEALLRQYDRAYLIAVKVTPLCGPVPAGHAQEMILPVRLSVERELLERERLTGGRAFANIGRCVYCPEGECTRPAGEPCRHPEKVRPSLEAFGFDIGKTLSELFGIEIKWGKDGFLPEYLVLVSGLFC